MKVRLRCTSSLRIVAALCLMAGASLALDPHSPASAFIRTGFTVENGLPSNVVNAIVQTRNGFLWIATDDGLARFNGRQFLPIYFRLPPPAPQGVVQALTEGTDGALWVGTGAGLVRIALPALDFFDPSLTTSYHLGPGPSDEVTCLLVTKSGELWAGTNNGLFHLQHGVFVSVSPGAINHIKETADGHLLIIMQGKLMEWNGANLVEHSEIARQIGIKADDFEDVLQDQAGTIWICTRGGLAKKEGNRVSKFYGFAGGSSKLLNTHRVYQDERGNVWVQFSEGLYRVSAAKPGLREPLIASAARVIYGDRDGGLWVGTNGDGLMRFKDRLVTMFTKQDGLPNDTTMTVLSRKDGSIWVGNNCAGLSVFNQGRFRTYAEKDGLLNSCVWALAEDQQDNLWIGTWGGGVFRLNNGRFTQFSKQQGLAGNVVRGITAARDGSLWLATDAGVSHLLNGAFHNYTVHDGLSSDHILDIHQGRDGGIWVGTSAGIDRMSAERFVPVASADKIVDAHSIHFAEGMTGELYATGAPKGVDLVNRDRLVNLNDDLNLSGMSAFQQDFWFSGVNGIFRFAARSLTNEDRQRDVPADYTSFGVSDGMNTAQCSIGTPNMAISRDGKLWVATVKGLAQLDLNQLPANQNKPSLWVAEVTIGRKRQVGGRELIVPPGTRHTELHFDSVSLASSEKLRFQYRMDDIDPVWFDADSSLTAVYTNIPIGKHLFHVRACNSDGIWDPVGISYLVTQQPYLYETTWARLSAIALLIMILAAAYRLRLKQIAEQYNMRLEERVNERTRIARDLHDTLLQSFHGLMLRFQAVENLLPERGVDAKRSLAIAIDRAASAITEGRDAVQELRTSRANSSDLVQSLSSLGQAMEAELVVDQTSPSALPTYRVLVEGRPRQINAGLLDDLYQIVKEAVSNAFVHAHATGIEVDVRFDKKMLRLRVRDDGVGINPDIAVSGRVGHWGLPGMRERASGMGGQLELWSEPGRGTEIEVTIPASVAYKKITNTQR